MVRLPVSAALRASCGDSSGKDARDQARVRPDRHVLSYSGIRGYARILELRS
jgi:hypothetical protein